MKRAVFLLLCILLLAVGGILALRVLTPVFSSPSPTALPVASSAPIRSTVTPETPAPADASEYFTLSFVGDCTLGSSPRTPLSWNFQHVVGENYAWPFAATRQYLEDDYLTVANMEGVFTTATQAKGIGIWLKSMESWYPTERLLKRL